MKVKQTSQKTLKAIKDLTVGTPFLAPRTDNKGDGFYMKVDKNSGLIDIKRTICAEVFKTDTQFCIAVNLETGQLRTFSPLFKVEPIDAEITVK